MRLSMHPNEQGYNLSLAVTASVRLNGLTVGYCVAADEEERWVKVLDIELLKYRSRLLTIPHRRLYGDVRILLGDRK